jgi:hypothetical protein
MRDNWTSARLLYEAAGRPPCPKPTHPADGDCYLCGLPCGDEGVKLRNACGPAFTDYHLAQAPGSDAVCVPCAWALAGKPPNSFRLWSAVYREDRPPGPSHEKAQEIEHLQLTSRAEIGGIVDVLLEPPAAGPWFCAVTSSGKVHTLPFTPVNLGGSAEWSVRFDRQTITTTTAQTRHVMHHTNALLAAGFLREDVLSGQPHPSKLVKHGIDIWRCHAKPLSRYRESALLELVVSLARKETYSDVRNRTA